MVDQTIVANAVAAAAVIVPGFFAWKTHQKKITEIHYLVNSRLTSALTEIVKLEARLETLGELPFGPSTAAVHPPDWNLEIPPHLKGSDGEPVRPPPHSRGGHVTGERGGDQ